MHDLKRQRAVKTGLRGAGDEHGHDGGRDVHAMRLPPLLARGAWRVASVEKTETHSRSMAKPCLVMHPSSTGSRALDAVPGPPGGLEAGKGAGRGVPGS